MSGDISRIPLVLGCEGSCDWFSNREVICFPIGSPRLTHHAFPPRYIRNGDENRRHSDSLGATRNNKLFFFSLDMPKVKKNLEMTRNNNNDGTGLTNLPCIQTMQFVHDDDLPVCTDAMLQDMFSNNNNDDQVSPSSTPPLESSEKQCPVCQVNLDQDQIDRQDGSGVWSYYRCPSVTDYTKCYIASGADVIDFYLTRVMDTLHPVYRPGTQSYNPGNLRCYCQKSLILGMSNSVKNKFRLYFKCPKRECNFFQWADTDAVGKVRRWLHQGVNPDAKGKEQRHKPYDLQKPIPRASQNEVRRPR